MLESGGYLVFNQRACNKVEILIFYGLFKCICIRLILIWQISNMIYNQESMSCANVKWRTSYKMNMKHTQTTDFNLCFGSLQIFHKLGQTLDLTVCIELFYRTRFTFIRHFWLVIECKLANHLPNTYLLSLEETEVDWLLNVGQPMKYTHLSQQVMIAVYF